ncbi:cytochrome P450 1A1-like isoform X3 [Ptychodera flava]|uniref:cytochrome P450 1A1-like isoform X3 n=1 Tax=Ptychodera flava TaxID=63121 RepID=UPI00396A9F1A
MVCAIPSALHAFLSSPTNVIAAVILLLVLTALWSVLLPNGFPPGPVAWPFLGISSALKGDLSKALTDLTERYGDILSIKVSGRRKVVINDVNMVREALVKKQNEFAGRPWRYYLGLLSEGGESIFHCSYSPKWMTRRKLLVRAIRNATSGRKMNDSIGKAILQLKNSVDDRNEEPFNPRHYFQLTVGGAVASMCFGRKYGFDDPEFQEIIKTAENVVKGFGQRFSADVFPILRHVPTKGVCEIKKVISRWLMLIQSKIDQRKAKPNEVGHVITGDLNLVEHHHLRKILSCGPKSGEPRRINWNHNFKIIMDSVEEYARKWAKREDVELDTLSEWVKSMRKIVRGRIGRLRSHVCRRPYSVFKDPNAVQCLNDIHDKYVVVPADKAANNIVFVCKKYYFECLIDELGVTKTSTNSTINIQQI